MGGAAGQPVGKTAKGAGWLDPWGGGVFPLVPAELHCLEMPIPGSFEDSWGRGSPPTYPGVGPSRGTTPRINLSEGISQKNSDARTETHTEASLACPSPWGSEPTRGGVLPRTHPPTHPSFHPTGLLTYNEAWPAPPRASSPTHAPMLTTTASSEPFRSRNSSSGDLAPGGESSWPSDAYCRMNVASCAASVPHGALWSRHREKKRTPDLPTYFTYNRVTSFYSCRTMSD